LGIIIRGMKRLLHENFMLENFNWRFCECPNKIK